MTKCNHLFSIGQKVRCMFDGVMYSGIVTKTETDHIIVDVPKISDHCYFDSDMLDLVYPDYNFN